MSVVQKVIIFLNYSSMQSTVVTSQQEMSKGWYIYHDTKCRSILFSRIRQWTLTNHHGWQVIYGTWFHSSSILKYLSVSRPTLRN